MIKKAAEIIERADCLIIGASNGFSISEGLNIFADNESFRRIFGDYREKYGLRSIIHGCMGVWPDINEKWDFWKRLVENYCFSYEGSHLMNNLKEIIGKKDYFIVTTNGESHFQLAGLDAAGIYQIEGSFLELQCSRPCCSRIYSIADYMKVDKMPICPECGEPMAFHVEADGSFIKNDNQMRAFEEFVEKNKDKGIAILELGIGSRNTLIKEPLMRLCARLENASYIAVNKGELYIPEYIENKAVGLDGDLNTIVESIRETLI